MQNHTNQEGQHDPISLTRDNEHTWTKVVASFVHVTSRGDGSGLGGMSLRNHWNPNKYFPRGMIWGGGGGGDDKSMKQKKTTRNFEKKCWEAGGHNATTEIIKKIIVWRGGWSRPMGLGVVTMQPMKQKTNRKLKNDGAWAWPRKWWGGGGVTMQPMKLKKTTKEKRIFRMGGLWHRPRVCHVKPMKQRKATNILR